MVIDFFCSIIYNEEIAKMAFLLALVLIVPLLLGFFISLIQYQTRFKKLGTILWFLLMVLILGIVVLALCRFQVEPLWEKVVRFGCIAAMIPLYLASSAMGRVFNCKKKFHWLVFPVLYGFSFIQGAAWGWCFEFRFSGEYTEEALSDEVMKSWEGYDFEIETPKLSNYEAIRLKIKGKGDSVYYRVEYYLCPFILDNKDWLAQFTEPLEENVTPWILLDTEKASIANRLRESMMTYELEWSGAGDSPGCFNIEIKDLQQRIGHFGLFCGARKLNKPKMYALKEMKDSLWPSRETYTSRTFEEAEKACKESQNYTGE